MKQYRLAVSALVVKPSDVCAPDGCSTIYSILLVHKPRKRDAWQLPQGGVEKGESASQAALRELEEEAGIRLPEVTHVSACEYTYDFPPDFIQKHQPVNAGQKLCFVAIEAPKDLKIKVDGKEIDSYMWILPEQLPQYLERKEYRTVVENVLKEFLAKKSGA